MNEIIHKYQTKEQMEGAAKNLMNRVKEAPTFSFRVEEEKLEILVYND